MWGIIDGFGNINILAELDGADIVMSPTTKTQVSHLITHFLIYLLLV